MLARRFFWTPLAILALAACGREPTASHGVVSLEVPLTTALLADVQAQGLPVILRNGTSQGLFVVACDGSPRFLVERFAGGAWQPASTNCPVDAPGSLALLGAGAFRLGRLSVAAPGRYRTLIQGATPIEDLRMAQGMVRWSAPFEVR